MTPDTPTHTRPARSRAGAASMRSPTRRIIRPLIRPLIRLAAWQAALLLAAPPAHAWDPVNVFNGAVHTQLNRQIRQGVNDLFRSIENPSSESRPANVPIQAAGPADIVLYGTEGCGYCRRARQHLVSRQIPYVNKDVQHDRQAESEFRALRGRGVPLILLGDQKLVGFSAATFDRAYKKFQAQHPAASPQTAAASASLNTGDVLAARIGRVQVLADADDQATRLGYLAKHEEVIYLGQTQGRYIKVQGADHSGWVDQALVAKP